MVANRFPAPAIHGLPPNTHQPLSTSRPGTPSQRQQRTQNHNHPDKKATAANSTRRNPGPASVSNTIPALGGLASKGKTHTSKETGPTPASSPATSRRSASASPQRPRHQQQQRIQQEQSHKKAALDMGHASVQGGRKRQGQRSNSPSGNGQAVRRSITQLASKQTSHTVAAASSPQRLGKPSMRGKDAAGSDCAAPRRSASADSSSDGSEAGAQDRTSLQRELFLMGRLLRIQHDRVAEQVGWEEILLG